MYRYLETNHSNFLKVAEKSNMHFVTVLSLTDFHFSFLRGLKCYQLFVSLTLVIHTFCAYRCCKVNSWSDYMRLLRLKITNEPQLNLN